MKRLLNSEDCEQCNLQYFAHNQKKKGYVITYFFSDKNFKNRSQYNKINELY